jgi:hypothetical protein
MGRALITGEHERTTDMKILGISGNVMLHLERDEAIAFLNMIDPNNSEMLKQMARDKHGTLLSEIVRQIDICLNLERA